MTRTSTSAILVCLLLALIINPAQAADRAVSAYYYPWYDLDRHWAEGYLRALTLPAQLPEQGEYSSRDSGLIDRHLAWSEQFGIDTWVCSWWGPGSWEDLTIKDSIAPRMAGRDVTYCLFYEAAGLLNLTNDEILFDTDRIATFRSHLQYMAVNYFDDPSYHKINGRPVVYIYLTRTFAGDYQQALRLVREDVQALGFALYLVGDEVYWDPPNAARIASLDAITAYNMHGPPQYAGYAAASGFVTDVAARYAQYQAVAAGQGVAFIPNIMPGFNDRGVRLSADHYVISPRSDPGAGIVSTFSLLADMADNFIDPALNTVCITSFNEWHEDTQIEPSVVTESTNSDQSGTGAYTQGFFYQGYGTGLLQVVADKFGLPVPAQKTNLGSLKAQYR